MMTMPTLPQLDRRNIILLTGCAVALLVFVCVALLPNMYKYRRQAMAIRHGQAQLNAQNDLNTLFRKLEAKRVILAELDTMSPAKPEPLRAGDMSRIALILREMSDKKGVVVDEVQPLITSGNLPSHRVRIQAIMHGNLEQYRALLLDLLREPYVEEIEQLTFEASGSDITLRIILAIKVA